MPTTILPYEIAVAFCVSSKGIFEVRRAAWPEPGGSLVNRGMAVTHREDAVIRTRASAPSFWPLIDDTPFGKGRPWRGRPSLVVFNASVFGGTLPRFWDPADDDAVLAAWRRARVTVVLAGADGEPAFETVRRIETAIAEYEGGNKAACSGDMDARAAFFRKT